MSSDPLLRALESHQYTSRCVHTVVDGAESSWRRSSCCTLGSLGTRPEVQQRVEKACVVGNHDAVCDGFKAERPRYHTNVNVWAHQHESLEHESLSYTAQTLERIGRDDVDPAKWNEDATRDEAGQNCEKKVEGKLNPDHEARKQALLQQQQANAVRNNHLRNVKEGRHGEEGDSGCANLLSSPSLSGRGGELVYNHAVEPKRRVMFFGEAFKGRYPIG